MTELLHCPFCGGRQTYRKHDGGVLLTATNHKRGCIMRDVLPFVTFNTEAEAIEAWNTRADAGYGAIPATDENMAKYGWVRERMCEITYKRGAMYDVARYSCCGYELAMPVSEILPAENYCPNCGARVVDE